MGCRMRTSQRPLCTRKHVDKQTARRLLQIRSTKTPQTAPQTKRTNTPQTEMRSDRDVRCIRRRTRSVNVHTGSLIWIRSGARRHKEARRAPQTILGRTPHATRRSAALLVCLVRSFRPPKHSRIDHQAGRRALRGIWPDTHASTKRDAVSSRPCHQAYY